MEMPRFWAFMAMFEASRSVSNAPGRRKLMVTLEAATERATPARNAVRPARAPEERSSPESGIFTEPDVMLTMRPNFLVHIESMTFCASAIAQPRPSPRLEAHTMALRPEIPSSMGRSERYRGGNDLRLYTFAPASCPYIAQLYPVAWIERTEIRGRRLPAFRHSTSKARVNVLMAQCGLHQPAAGLGVSGLAGQGIAALPLLAMQPSADQALPTAADVDAAPRRLAAVALRTPLLTSPVLDALTGARVVLKAETLQRTGSFKFRGAYNKLSSIPQGERAGGVVAFSSGNHAQGVAAAAQLLGMPAVIVMPSDSPPPKRERTPAPGPG